MKIPTTNTLTHEDARKHLEREGYTVQGYEGIGPTGWHRFSVQHGPKLITIDVRSVLGGQTIITR